MARVEVHLISAGVRELVNNDDIRRHLESRGRRVLAKAKQNAPVITGDLRNSIRLISTTTDRPSIRVGSDDNAAMLVESRTGFLARSLDAARGSS